jgi:hypothetical protein
MLVVIMRTDMSRFVTHIDADTVACGVGDLLGNKGGVVMSMKLFGTSICIVGCHLAARAERLSQRRDNFLKIVRQAKVGMSNWDILSQHTHVLWLGDLNYRVDLDWDATLELIDLKAWSALMMSDQLLAQQEAGKAFVGFSEGTIDWKPSYRCNRKTDEWSNKRRQAPSYTDRILYRSLAGCNKELELVDYVSHPNVKGSDHRPVSAFFKLHVRNMYTGDRLVASASLNASRDFPCTIDFSGASFTMNTDATDSIILPANGVLYAQFHASFLYDGKKEGSSSSINVNDPSVIRLYPSSSSSASPSSSSAASDNVTSFEMKADRVVGLMPFIYDTQWLKDQYLLVHLFSQSVSHKPPELFGSCCVPLGRAYDGLPEGDKVSPNFNVSVMSGGNLAGRLKGTFSLSLREPWRSVLAAETKAEAEAAAEQAAADAKEAKESPAAVVDDDADPSDELLGQEPETVVVPDTNFGSGFYSRPRLTLSSRQPPSNKRPPLRPRV